MEVYESPKKKVGKSVTVKAFCSGKTIKVFVDPGDKVSDVKRMIEEELHVPCDQQRLFLDDGELEDDEDALSRVITWLIRDIVLIQRDVDNVLFLVSVSKHSSTHIIHFDPSDAIMDVKVKLQETVCVGEVKTLFFQERQLNDKETLADCNVQKQSTIHFKVQYSYDLMKIKIKLLSGDTITLLVEKDGSESIKSVKSMIQEKLSMPVEEQQLRFEGREMNDDKLLKDYITKNTMANDSNSMGFGVPTFTVAPRQCPPIQLFLKTATGISVLVQAYSYDTIADLKASIQEKEGIPVDQQHLTFNGMHLEEGKLVSENGILPECTLHLTTRSYSQFLIFIKERWYNPAVPLEVKSCDTILKESWYKPAVTLEVKSCDTIGTLKSRIQDKLQNSNREFVLKFDKKRLEDDNETIQHCGIKRNSTLRLDYQCEYYTICSGVQMQVNYRWKLDGEILSDSLYTINAVPPCTPFQMPIFVAIKNPHAYAYMGYIAVGCSPTTTLENVALSIQSILKGMKALMSEKFLLTFNEEELNENHTLSDCGIQRGSVLHLKANIYLPSFTFPSKFAPSQPMSQFPVFIQEDKKGPQLQSSLILQWQM